MRISDWSSDVCSSDLCLLSQGCFYVGKNLLAAVSHRGNIVFPALRASGFLPFLQVGIGRAIDLIAIFLEIGRASCRERVCKYVEISWGPVSLKKKKHERTNIT